MWQQLFLYVCLGLVCAFATCCWDINWFSAQVHPSEKHGFSCGDPVSNNWHPVIWLLKPDGGEIKNKIWTCPIETINFLPKTLQANQQQFTDLIFWKNLGLRQVIGSLMVSSAIEGFRSLGGPGKKQNYKNTLKFATYLLLLFWRKNIVLTKCPLHWNPCATTPCHEDCSTPDTTSPNADSEGWSRPLPRAHIPKTQGESHQSRHLQTWMTGCRLGAPVFGWSRDITFL